MHVTVSVLAWHQPSSERRHKPAVRIKSRPRATRSGEPALNLDSNPYDCLGLSCYNAAKPLFWDSLSLPCVSGTDE